MTVWLLLDFSVYFKPHLFAKYCQLTNNTKTYPFLSVHITLTSKLCWTWERWKKELQNPQIVGKKWHLFWLSFLTNIIWILQKNNNKQNHCNESGNYILEYTCIILTHYKLMTPVWHLKIKSDRLESGIYVILNISKLKGQFSFSDLLCEYICCICLIYWNLL